MRRDRYRNEAAFPCAILLVIATSTTTMSLVAEAATAALMASLPARIPDWAYGAARADCGRHWFTSMDTDNYPRCALHKPNRADRRL